MIYIDKQTSTEKGGNSAWSLTVHVSSLISKKDTPINVKAWYRHAAQGHIFASLRKSDLFIIRSFVK